MTTDHIDPEQQERYIAIWSKAVDTQMHFNEMSAKSRQLGLTFVVAVLGVAVVLLSRGNDFAFTFVLYGYTFQMHVSVVLFVGAWLALEAVKVLDLNVYHKMLRGAVAFGEDFEENYMKKIFNLQKGMTQSISHFSRYKDAATESSNNGSYQYKGSTLLTAEDKIKKFYKNAQTFMLIGALLLLAGTNFANWEYMNTEDLPSAPAATTESLLRQ